MQNNYVIINNIYDDIIFVSSQHNIIGKNQDVLIYIILMLGLTIVVYGKFWDM